jgi:hypothetical protein
MPGASLFVERLLEVEIADRRLAASELIRGEKVRGPVADEIEADGEGAGDLPVPLTEVVGSLVSG